MAESTYRRRKKLIKPGLQMRLIGAFAGISTLAILLQFLVLGYFITTAAQSIDGGGGELAAQVPRTLLLTMAVSLVVLLPLLFVIGLLLTFRFAGPIYRFEQYLLALARGEKLGPCQIRTGDELQFLCHAINLATEPLRQAQEEKAESKPAPEPEYRVSA